MKMIRILRERVWIIHASINDPFERLISHEFTIFNESNTELHHIILDLGELFYLGLKIYDQDGSELPFYPKWFLRDLLTEIGFDENAVNAITRPGRYILFIELPKNSPIHPQRSRVIKMHYYDVEPYVKGKAGVFRTTDRSPFFSSYRFHLLETKQDEEYDTFFLVKGPDGYGLEFTKDEATGSAGNELTKADGYYEDLRQSIINIRLPGGIGQVHFRGFYRILPPSSEKWLFFVSFVPLSVLTALLILITLDITVPLENLFIMRQLRKAGSEIAAGIMVACLSIAALIRDPLFNRSRIYYLIVAALAFVSYLISTS